MSPADRGMLSTMDLLAKASMKDSSDANWCKAMGVSRTTIAVARIRGRLSPAVAGKLALLVEEDPTHWIAIAALEAAPPSRLREDLFLQINSFGTVANS